MIKADDTKETVLSLLKDTLLDIIHYNEEDLKCLPKENSDIRHFAEGWANGSLEVCQHLMEKFGLNKDNK